MRRSVLALVLALAAACGPKSTPQPVPDRPPPDGQPAAGACITTGCSGTLCVEPGNEVMTTCEFKPEYACYKAATCERQADGACGWTQTPELAACLANPPPVP